MINGAINKQIYDNGNNFHLGQWYDVQNGSNGNSEEEFLNSVIDVQDQLNYGVRIVYYRMVKALRHKSCHIQTPPYTHCRSFEGNQCVCWDLRKPDENNQCTQRNPSKRNCLRGAIGSLCDQCKAGYYVLQDGVASEKG